MRLPNLDLLLVYSGGGCLKSVDAKRLWHLATSCDAEEGGRDLERDSRRVSRGR